MIRIGYAYIGKVIPDIWRQYGCLFTTRTCVSTYCGFICRTLLLCQVVKFSLLCPNGSHKLCPHPSHHLPSASALAVRKKYFLIEEARLRNCTHTALSAYLSVQYVYSLRADDQQLPFTIKRAHTNYTQITRNLWKGLNEYVHQELMAGSTAYMYMYNLHAH